MSDMLDDLKAAWAPALAELESELADASFVAAGVGVQAAQQSHPYTDRTGDLTGTAEAADDARNGKRGALMVWPMPYGEYVDKGTSRSKAYPFTPIAREAADTALQGLAQTAADRFASRLSSG